MVFVLWTKVALALERLTNSGLHSNWHRPVKLLIVLEITYKWYKSSHHIQRRVVYWVVKKTCFFQFFFQNMLFPERYRQNGQAFLGVVPGLNGLAVSEQEGYITGQHVEQASWVIITICKLEPPACKLAQQMLSFYYFFTALFDKVFINYWIWQLGKYWPGFYYYTRNNLSYKCSEHIVISQIKSIHPEIS